MMIKQAAKHVRNYVMKHILYMCICSFY